MNIKTILNILAAMLGIIGLSMLFPVLIAYLYNEPDLSGYFYSMALCLSISIPVWFLTRKNRKLSSRDGFALVTFAWIIVAIAGSLPFYLTGSIPNYTDAWFESMSGVTTTGATIIGNVTTLPNLVDGIESLVQSGITAIIQPHGSIKDKEIIKFANDMGIVLIFSKSRHFRH